MTEEEKRALAKYAEGVTETINGLLATIETMNELIQDMDRRLTALEATHA